MSENLPVLYRNVMDGLPSDFARDAFLWAVERPGEDRMCYRAERFAREADALVKTLAPMFDAASRILSEQMPHLSPNEVRGHDPDLMRFCLQRHANWRFGGNVAPSYCAVPA